MRSSFVFSCARFL